MNNQVIFNAPSRTELEGKLDAVLAEGKPFKSIPLILPAQGGCARTSYKDFSIRYWHDFATGADRYDAAIEYL